MNKYTDADASNLIRTEKSRRDLNDITNKYIERFKREISEGRLKLEDVTKCECCSGNEFTVVSTIDRFSMSFGNSMCNKCGLLSTSPRLKEADLPYYYSEFYHRINYGKESLEDQEQLFSAEQGKKIFSILAPHIIKQEISILEIGSGVGDVITGFMDADKSRDYSLAVGTEFNDECISVSEARARKMSLDVSFIRGGFAEAKEFHKSYDVILLSHVFEHCVDLDKVLKDVKSMLAADGLLYIEVPGLFVNHRIGYYNYAFIDYTIHAHIYNFCAQSLENIVCRRGFETVSINENVEAVFKRSKRNKPKNIEDVSCQTLFYLNLIGTKEHFDFNEVKDEAIDRLKLEINDVKPRLRDKSEELEKKQSALLDKTEKLATNRKELHLKVQDFQLSKKDLQLTVEDLQLTRKDLQLAETELRSTKNLLTKTNQDLQLTKNVLDSTKEQVAKKNDDVLKFQKDICQLEKKMSDKSEKVKKLESQRDVEKKELNQVRAYFSELSNLVKDMKDSKIKRHPLEKWRRYKKLTRYHFSNKLS